MSFGAYVGGSLAVLAFFFGAFVVAIRLRRVLLPDAAGATAVLVNCVGAAALATLLPELLGSFGWLGRWQLGVAMAVPVVVALAVSAGRRRRVRQRGRRSHVAFFTVLGAAAVVAAVVGQWVSWSAVSLHSGPSAVDTLRYHLPLVGRFVQGQHLTHLQFLDQDLLPTYDPLNAEMVHLDVAVLFRSDQLTALVNVGWLGMALVAAAALARRVGRLHVQLLLAVGVAVALPVMVVSNGGAAANDLAALALLLASATSLISALPEGDGTAGDAWRPDRTQLGLLATSGLAAGLAVGTKFYALIPVAVLVVAVGWLWRGRFFVTMGSWLGPGLLTGSFWFARNWAAAGNPFPETSLKVGPIHLVAVNDPVFKLTAYSVAHYATHSGFWRHTFAPGMSQALGPAWWAILTVSAVGVIAALVYGGTAGRLLGVLGIVSAAGYVVTPYSAGGAPGFPYLFAPDVRFLTPAIAFGLIGLVWVRRASHLWRRVWTVVLAVLLLSAMLPSGLYSGWPSTDRGYGVLAAVVVAGLVVVVYLQRFVAIRTVWALAGVGLVAVSVAAGFFVAHRYPARRYVGQPIARWAARLHGAKIGEIGYPLLYPLFGNDFTNRVVYLARPDGSGNLVPNTSCTRWKATLEAFPVGYVVVGKGTLVPTGTPEIGWTTALYPTRLVLTDAGTTVLRITGAERPDGCQRPST